MSHRSMKGEVLPERLLPREVTAGLLVERRERGAEGIATRIVEYFSVPLRASSDVFPELTEREREILELIAKGLSNQVIAQRLFLSPKTVRNHVSNIFAKLQVADRAEAIVRAREAGLGQSGAPGWPPGGSGFDQPAGEEDR